MDEKQNYSSTLKRVQIMYEQQISRIVHDLDQRSLERQHDCKECVAISKEAGRMTKRWRNLTSLSVETFSLLNAQVNNERSAIQQLEIELLQQNKSVAAQQKENAKLQNLVSLLESTVKEEQSRRQ